MTQTTIKGALFDMDGVLVDNMRIHSEAFGILCKRYGANNYTGSISHFAGRSNEEIMRALFPPEVVERYGWQTLSDEKEAIYRELYAAQIKPAKGLVTFLKQLTGNGIRCAVGSSACRLNVEFVFERCGIGPYFSAVVSSDIVTRCKPDPEIYLKAAEALHLEPAECVVFEDALAGIEAGRRAGMKVVALATSLSHEELTAAGASLVIDDFTQIDLDRLRRL